jgi:L-threonylcarbamoyladenylate synthase
MERCNLADAGVVEKAAAVLRSGGVVLYPTDTLYGLGADALSDAAVAKIYKIKEREEKKPIHAVVADMKMAAEYGEVHDYARMLADAFLPGPLTLVLTKKVSVNTGIARHIDTFGIRVPNHGFCLELARVFGKPYTTTSANIAGAEHTRSVDAILEQLHDHAGLIDLVVDAGELAVSEPSTVVDVSKPEPVIVREGAISAGDIWSVIREDR